MEPFTYGSPEKAYPGPTTARDWRVTVLGNPSLTGGVLGERIGIGLLRRRLAAAH